jgi:hypothetical protein
LISLNILQRTSQTILVMSGGMDCKGANPDNCCYDEHCCEKTFSDFPFCFFLIIFHNLAAKGRCPFLSRRKTKELLSHSANASQPSGSACALAYHSGRPRLYESGWRAGGFASLLGAHRALVPRLRELRHRLLRTRSAQGSLPLT